jgi:hypothetical protein
LIPTLLLLVVAGGAFAIFRADRWGDRANDASSPYGLDLERSLAIDPELVRFVQVAQFPIPSERVVALAVGARDSIYVAGDRAVHVLGNDGTPHAVIATEGQPTCLAVGRADDATPARVYVGTDRQIEIYDLEGTLAQTWPLPSEASVLTSIAVAEGNVFVADAGERVVLRFNDKGDLVGRIGAPDPDRQMPGFIVPSPVFDVALGPDGKLFVVNPGARRIQMHAPEGELESFWGEASSAISGFFGCCNPAHLALFSDGRFITSEKGIPRLKVYSAAGDFEAVVAGPRELGIPDSAIADAREGARRHVFDVAADRKGQVLVLDPVTKSVRVFAPKEREDNGRMEENNGIME